MKNALRYLLLALPIILPTYLLRLKIGPLPTTVLEIVVLAIIGLFTVTYKGQGYKDAWTALKTFRLPLIAFTFFSLAAVFWSPVPVQGLGLWRAYVLEPRLLLMVFVVSIGRDVRREEIERSLYVSVLLLAMWGVVEYLFGVGIPSPWNVAISEGRRATGPFPYPNALALAVVPIGAYGLSRFISSRDRLGFITFVMALIASFVARSDGGFIALAAVLWLALVSIKRLRWPVIVVTIIGLAVGFGVSEIREPVLKELRLENWSGYVRKKMWQDTTVLLKDHPIKGAGMAGYPTVFKPYQTTTGIEIFQYPHNIILNFWVETGLAGLLAFFWIVFAWLKKKEAMLLPLVALLIHGLVDVPYFKNDLAIVFFLLLALCAITQSASLRTSQGQVK